MKRFFFSDFIGIVRVMVEGCEKQLQFRWRSRSGIPLQVLHEALSGM
jgi:hypothetical protein